MVELASDTSSGSGVAMVLGGVAVFCGMDCAEALLDFNRLGPTGNCSNDAGTKGLGLEVEEVVNTVPFNRTIGLACFDPVSSK